MQLVELEDGARWLTMARTVTPQGRRYGAVPAEFAVGIGVAAELGGGLAVARGHRSEGGGDADRARLSRLPAQRLPAALGAAARARALLINERERGVSPFTFAGD